MTVTDKKIDKAANVARETITFPIDDVGANEADSLVGAFKPGYEFEIEDVQVFAVDVTAEASVDVKVGTTSALSAAVDLDAEGDATRADGTLSTTLADVQGSASDVLNVHVTTDAGGAIEELAVYVTIRPRFMDGDPPKIL